MAEPRKVQFVTLSAFAAGAAAESRKRRLEEESDFSLARAGEAEAASGAGAGAGADRSRVQAEKRATVRLSLSLSEPSDASSAEFNYGELVQNLQVDSPRSRLGSGWTCSWSWNALGVFVRTCGGRAAGGGCTFSSVDASGRTEGPFWLRRTKTAALLPAVPAARRSAFTLHK